MKRSANSLKAAAAVMTFAFVMAGCGKSATSASRTSPKFSDDVHQFVASATRLDALTSQGVNHDKFGDQLATVRAEFEVLNREWPEQFHPESRKNLQSAIQGWQLTYMLWSREIQEHIAIGGSSWRDYEVDPELGEQARQYLTEGGVKKIPNTLHYYRTKEALLTVASRYFNDAVTGLAK